MRRGTEMQGSQYKSFRIHRGHEEGGFAIRLVYRPFPYSLPFLPYKEIITVGNYEMVYRLRQLKFFESLEKYLLKCI